MHHLQQPGDHRGSRLRRRAPSRTLEDAADEPGRPALAGQPVAGPGLARRAPPARSGADAGRDRRAVHRARRAPPHHSDVERLWRRTEGWVAGLRLAAAGLKDRADVSAAVAEFSGRTPVVADLLADELLHRAPKELSEFLLRTSVADVLDAELCDALSGRSDSGDVLRRMEADLQFVMATGPEPGHLAVSPAAGRDAALGAADAPPGRSARTESPGRRDPAGAGRHRRRGPLSAGRR